MDNNNSNINSNSDSNSDGINNGNNKNNNLNNENQGSFKFNKIIYYILGVLEVLFAFRLVFKILGANPDSAFVTFIYSATNLFLAPFDGIFRKAVTQGIETEAVLEPTLIIAMLVYAALAWGIVKLVEILSNRKEDSNTL